MEASPTSPNDSPRHVRFLEELDLHRRIRERDAAALLDCLDRFGALVFCALFHVTGDVPLTEDLTEQAFVSLWRSPNSFDPRHGPMSLQLLGATLSVLRRATRSTSTST